MFGAMPVLAERSLLAGEVFMCRAKDRGTKRWTMVLDVTLAFGLALAQGCGRSEFSFVNPASPASATTAGGSTATGSWLWPPPTTGAPGSGPHGRHRHRHATHVRLAPD